MLAVPRRRRRGERRSCPAIRRRRQGRRRIIRGARHDAAAHEGRVQPPDTRVFRRGVARGDLLEGAALERLLHGAALHVDALEGLVEGAQPPGLLLVVFLAAEPRAVLVALDEEVVRQARAVARRVQGVAGPPPSLGREEGVRVHRSRCS